MLKAICIFFLFNYGVRVRSDIFTAVAEFENVLEAHKTIKDYLDTYIKRHEKRIAILKSYLNVFNREHEKAMENIPKYLENPVNIFTLIKRLTIDLDFIKYSIVDETAYIEDITNKQYANKYPTMEDVAGAAEALVRLQYVYNMEAKELAKGKLYDIDYSTSMTACDCYELGRVLYDKKIYVYGLEWMLEAFRKYNVEGIHYAFTDIDILGHISFGYLKTGDMESALYWIQKLYDIDPYNSRARQIEQQCRNNMRDSRYNIWQSKMQEEKELRRLLKDPHEFAVNPLCRGDSGLPMEISSRLTCRYQTEHHPFTKLAPIKTEMLYLNPDIILFHDMLSDSEIDTVVEMAKMRLFRSEIHISANEEASVKQRISKSAWIYDEESDVVARISRRVTHMTGLSLDSSKALQVANYGIAGYYNLHHDFFEMSNVTQGGATVFPKLGVSKFPVKGHALYWLNLHPSGERNHCMLHAACPVLTGSKWVATRWIHEVGQEFIKPCNLEYQEEGCLGKHPGPILKTPRKKKLC
ncbi:unnamed protein product [Arctia plantaginis]|uniref:procollagen-proline 4-dioxygenase n=1 Tax=Arctia plantaginis TaxID=874455 RepID=A0A8S0YZ03_ARCPL|nr:unnamed protein product [Arctia plantaginis]